MAAAEDAGNIDFYINSDKSPVKFNLQGFFIIKIKPVISLFILPGLSAC
jgi:hypothetical protein